MKIEFNLIPAEYSRRPSAWEKILSPRVAAAVILFCAAEFFAASFFMMPRLRNEAENAQIARDAALKQVQLLAARYEKLRGQCDFWKNFLVTAETSAPAHLILAQLLRALPDAAEVEAFSIDGARFQVEILFAGERGVNAFMRRMEKLPYGPMKILERRIVGQGSLLFRFEAPRRQTEKKR